MILSNPVGQLFAGRFLIEQPAGSGGMGTVYRARDATTERAVALKLLQSPSGHAGDGERFAREALLLSELKAPGIVGYVAHGTAPDGQRYLAMEWLDGEDLASRLRRGPLSVSETLILLRAISEALALAHGHGVIHRDLKPSNLFLPGSDVHRVKLLDFGIARRTAASQVMTRTGLLIGTPEYMAPDKVLLRFSVGDQPRASALGRVREARHRVAPAQVSRRRAWRCGARRHSLLRSLREVEVPAAAERLVGAPCRRRDALQQTPCARAPGAGDRVPSRQKLQQP